MLGEMDSATHQKRLIELMPVENKWHERAEPSSAVSTARFTTAQFTEAQFTEAQFTEAQFTEAQFTKAQFTEAQFTKARRYTIDPKDMLLVQKQAREKGLKIIGIYHSHPDHVAVPSECDRIQAWPEYAYTILSVQNGVATDILNWALDSEHQFQPEAMQTVSSQVSPSSATDRMPLPA